MIRLFSIRFVPLVVILLSVYHVSRSRIACKLNEINVQNVNGTQQLETQYRQKRWFSIFNTEDITLPSVCSMLNQKCLHSSNI